MHSETVKFNVGLYKLSIPLLYEKLNQSYQFCQKWLFVLKIGTCL